MNWDNIVYGAAFNISKEIREEHRDPKRLVEKNKAMAVIGLGQKIVEAKGDDLWKQRRDKDGYDLYDAKLFIFTPAELEEYKERIRKGEI